MMDKLGYILSEEEKLIKEMVELEEQIRQILIERDVRALQKLNGQKGQLAEKIQQLEKQRADLVPPGLTLKEYLGRENPPDADKLERLRQSMLELYDSLLRRQKITQRLLLFNRQMAEQAINLLMPREKGAGYLYSARGTKEQGETRPAGFLDSNA